MKYLGCTVQPVLKLSQYSTMQFRQDFTRAQFSLIFFYSCLRTHSDGVTTMLFQIEI
jgi:hypothetical protein